MDLGKASREQLLTVAKAATVLGETIHNRPFAVTPEMVVDAMVAADAYTRAYRQQSGKEPAAVAHDAGFRLAWPRLAGVPTELR